VDRLLRGNDNPAIRDTQRAEIVDEVRNLRRVMLVSRERGCAPGGGNPEA
jgi:hypothetical protein